MALLTGVKPVVNVLDVSQNTSFINMSLVETDQDIDNACVKMLLNSHSDVGFGTPVNKSQSLGNDFNLMTSSNKSLLLTSTNLADKTPIIANDLKLAEGGSYVAFKEKFRYKLEAPNDGKLSVNDDSNQQQAMVLSELDGDNLLASQDSFRRDTNNKLKTTIGSDALFVYDKIGQLGQDGCVSVISGDSSSGSNLTLTMDRTSNNPLDYPYGSGTVDYEAATLDITNSNLLGGLVKLNGSAVSEEFLTSPDSQYASGNTYSGNYADYNNLSSFSVEMKVSNDAVSSFTSDDNKVLFDPAQTQVNLSGLGNSYPKSDVVVSCGYSFDKYPISGVTDFLERVPVNSGAENIVQDMASSSTDITLDNRDKDKRMGGLDGLSAYLSSSNVLYTIFETDSSNGFVDALDSSKKDGDVSYDLEVLENSTVSNGKAQYIVVDNSNSTVSLLNGQNPKDNLVFSIQENTNLESVDDVNSNKLTNLDGGVDLCLDPSQNVESNIGADVVNSTIRTSLLRDMGVASVGDNNLRILFQHRLSDSALMATRQTSPQLSPPLEDGITKISLAALSAQSMVPGVCSASFGLRPEVDQSEDYKWFPEDSEAMPLSLLDSKALAYKISFSPYFVFGGSSLQEAVNQSSVTDLASGKKVYLPDAKSVRANSPQQALSADVNGSLVYTDVNSDLHMTDVNDAVVELLSTSLDNSVRTVTVKVTHSSGVPSLKNHQVSYNLTYKYYEGVKWNWYAPSSVGTKGVRPQPVVTLEINSKFVFSHVASVQGFSEGQSSWADLPNQNTNNLSLVQIHDSNMGNQLLFNDTISNSYNITLNLYCDNKLGSAPVLNNNYALPLVNKSGDWSASYLELNNGNMSNMNKENIQSLLNNNSPVALSVNVSRLNTNTTLKISAGVNNDLFKVVVPNNRLQDMCGYLMSSAWLNVLKVQEVSSQRAFVSDNVWLKLDSGVYVKTALLSSAPKGVLANLYLLNDLYSCVNPSISLTIVPNNKVLVNESLVYSTGSYKEIKALHRRGLTSKSTYRFNRQKIEATASWGDMLEKVAIDNATTQMYTQQDQVNYYYKAVFNFAKNVGLGVIINSFSGLDGSHTLRQHISRVDVTLKKLSDGNILKNTRVELPSDAQVPFVENYKLNNFWVPNQTVKLTLNNKDITVKFFNKYSWNSLNEFKNAVADKTVILSEDNFVSSNNQSVILVDGKKSLQINYVPAFRRVAKKVCFSCVPEILKIDLSSPSVYHPLLTLEPKLLSLGGSRVNTHSLDLSALASTSLLSGVHNYTVSKDSLLLSLQGSIDTGNPWDDGIDGDGDGKADNESYQPYTNISMSTPYLSSVSFNSDNFLTVLASFNVDNSSKVSAFQKSIEQNYNNLDGSIILQWNKLANRLARVDGWSNDLIVSPKITTSVKQYVLGFDMVEGAVVPVVHKLISAEFNPNKLQASSKLASGVSLIKLPCASKQKSSLSLPDGVGIGFPYNYTLAGVNYPSVLADKLLSLSEPLVNFVNNSSLNRTTLDLLVKVGVNGSQLFTDIFAAKKVGVNRVVGIFSKDQLVLEDSFGNLCLRVGPDGRLYTGDVSTYSLYCNAQNSVLGASTNGIMSLPLNNNAVLNNMVQ